MLIAVALALPAGGCGPVPRAGRSRSNAVPLLFFQRERQAQREDALELTEKLDRDWREIQGLLARRPPQARSTAQEKPQVGRRARPATAADLIFLRRKGARVAWPRFW